MTFCDGSCVDLDSKCPDCGRCGRRRRGAAVCRNGECETPACGLGLKRCNDGSVDTSRDPRKCDARGNACRANQTCVNGRCATCDGVTSGCVFSSVQAVACGALPGGTVTLCPNADIETLIVTNDVPLAGIGPDPAATAPMGESAFQATVTTAESVTLRNLTVTLNGGSIGGNTPDDCIETWGGTGCP